MKKSTNRVQLLKAVSTAVNEFYFSPSTVRKGKARQAVKELSEFIEAIELPKATKSKTSDKQSQGTDEMMELFKQFLATQGMMPDAPKVTKTKTKRRRKTTTKKANPQQRVADRQEKAHHGRPDTPITPCDTPKKASVEAARKSVEQLGKANGSDERIRQRALARKAEVLKAFQAKLDAEFPLDGTSNEISFSDLSLRELSNLM
jgi:hypothetical protein|tara:strand:+ start:239 stop:850 length:612 start_codon:yes stop_codon:yes gene_type:complete